MAIAQLADLRLGAQQLADKVNDASVDTATWNTWVNDGIESLYKKLAAQFDDSFYGTQDFNLAGGVAGNIFSLPSSSVSRAVLGVTKDPDTGSRLTIRRYNFAERNGSRSMWGAAPYCNVRKYRVMGGKLIIEPYEQAAGSYRLYYRPAPTILVGDTDPIDDVLNPWSEYVRCLAARKGLGREESAYDEVNQRLAELVQEIEDAAIRDEDEPATIVDVDNMNAGPWAVR